MSTISAVARCLSLLPAALLAPQFAVTPCAAAPATTSARESDAEVSAALRRQTQALIDAIAPGDAAVWDRLLDAHAIQVDENDVVRDKAQILAELKPLPPGLVGNLVIAEFRMVRRGDVAVVSHEDNEYLDYHGQIIRSRFRMTDTWIRAEQGWRQIASQALAVQQDPPSIVLSEEQLCAYAGRYELTTELTGTVRCEGSLLLFERPGKPARTFLPEVADVFFEPGEPRTRRIFRHGADGAITGFVDRREARDIAWRRVGPVPAP